MYGRHWSFIAWHLPLKIWILHDLPSLCRRKDQSVLVAQTVVVRFSSISADKCLAWRQWHAGMEHWCFYALRKNFAVFIMGVGTCLSDHACLILFQGCHPQAVGTFSVHPVVVAPWSCNSHSCGNSYSLSIYDALLYLASLEVSYCLYHLLCFENYKEPHKSDLDEYMTKLLHYYIKPLNFTRRHNEWLWEVC